MKIVSWNVNGLRSTEGEFLAFLDEYGPDVVMLQEVRAHPNQLSMFLTHVPGYKVEFNYSNRPGYSGTAIYYKDTSELSDISMSTGRNILDAEGRTILSSLGDLKIFNYYTPNGNSSNERLEYKLKFYDSIIEFKKGLLEKPVIIGGDLNVAHTELDLYNPKLKHSGFMPVERAWFSNLLEMGFVDSFRMFERGGGHYTWWHMRDPQREMNRGWRFDYFLVSEDLKDRVKAARILRDVYGSDHCPVLLEVDL